MAKAFSNKEKQQVIAALKREAEQCMIRYGMRKTSIDELVQRVGISKGSFYAFFPSKEMLFYEVIKEYHDQTQALIIERVQLLGERANSSQVADLLYDGYKQMDNPMMLHVMASGEMEWMMRKLPEEVASAHNQQDNMALNVLFERLSFVNQELIPQFSAALRAVFLTMRHKKEIGEPYFDEVLKTLLEGVCKKYISDEH